MPESRSIPYVYVLTPLTRIGGQRRTVMLGVDMERRTLLLLVLGLAISLPFVVIGWLMIDIYALGFAPLGVAIVFYAFSKSSGGLKQTQFRTRIDRMTSKSGQFMLCGRLIEPLAVKRGRVITATVPVKRAERTAVFDLPVQQLTR